MLSHVRLLATPWTIAYQAPLSMGFSRQEYWSGVPLPSPLKPHGMAKKKKIVLYLKSEVQNPMTDVLTRRARFGHLEETTGRKAI